MDLLNPILEASNLSVGYKAPILDNLSFKIYPGDMICLMGHNGCGKTTMLRTLARIIPAFSGKILVKNEDINSWSNLEYSRILSVVLTEKIENENMLVKELVALGRYPYTNHWGYLSSADNQIIDDSMHVLGIESLRNRKISELSDGQKQKVFVARAIAQDTSMLLLDEPTTYLDIPGKMEILRLLKEVALRKKIAILFSSHDWQLILEMVSWIWMIDDTGFLKVGVPEDLILNGEFENCFFHENFHFDKNFGNFREKINMKYKFFLEDGDTESRIWTTHALRKESFFEVAKKENNYPSIRIEKKDRRIYWIVFCDEGEFVAKSIEELVVILKMHSAK